MGKRQITFRIEESMVKEMERIREETGVSISTQVELRLRGYSIVKSSKSFLEWTKKEDAEKDD